MRLSYACTNLTLGQRFAAAIGLDEPANYIPSRKLTPNA